MARRAFTGVGAVLVLLAGGFQVHAPAHAQEAGGEVQRWQERRLFAPTDAELVRERSGHVMIYEGMKDTDVELAMDREFRRLESMMFVGTLVTDDRGGVMLDEETGRPIVEDDGCD